MSKVSSRSVYHFSGVIVQNRMMQEFIKRCQGAQILAILCNPPLKQSSLTTSWRNLQSLKEVLGAKEVLISNIIEIPTRSTEELRHLSGLLDHEELKTRIRSASGSADVTLAAWGAGAPAGWKKGHWAGMINSALVGMIDSGHDGAIHVGTGTRHPSRWRQYTSPIHQRYSGASFEDRLLESLQWSSTDCQWPRSSPRRRPVVLPAGGHGFSPVAASCFSP
ncbi:hypothetical protein ABH939_006414, partial [Rhodococcus sp. 27YEA6]